MYHIDSKNPLEKRRHLKSLKPILLNILIKSFQGNSKEFDENIDQEEFWDSIEIINCVSQKNESDSHFHCLRNVHEFLMEDKLEIDLLNSYQIYEILHYRLFVAACIMYNKYLTTY